MATYNHFLRMNNFKTLNNLLHEQAVEECRSSDSNVFDYARAMAAIENVIVVVSDIYNNVSHIYSGLFGERFQYLKPFDTHMMGWEPLAEGKNDFFTNPVLTAIGNKYGKSVAQVALRFLLQLGVIVIPKSAKIERMRQNLNVFDFNLSSDDMAQIRKLDTGKPFILGSHEDPELVKWFMQYKDA